MLEMQWEQGQARDSAWKIQTRNTQDDNKKLQTRSTRRPPQNPLDVPGDISATEALEVSVGVPTPLETMQSTHRPET